ncbi:MAG TPA: hypothetical protein VJ801_17110 [Polyangia bacterium]|jgi:hypothetical protein|nr:hypothetical protein [Polyangia bacterium]
MKPRLPGAIYAIGATSLLNHASSEMIFPILFPQHRALSEYEDYVNYVPIPGRRGR